MFLLLTAAASRLGTEDEGWESVLCEQQDEDHELGNACVHPGHHTSTPAQARVIHLRSS